MLKPAGVLRLVVPDLAYIIDEYRAGRIAADALVDELGVSYAGPHRGWKARLYPLVAFPHKCMYDHETLLATLRRHGFDANPAARSPAASRTLPPSNDRIAPSTP
ncbi:MAG: hypothetical protein HC809_12100 [Gammaproteobacteria bacterium]|nr:hypothetical protein [Gammaproteobacteria bacterium]